MTMKLLETVTVGAGGTASITFSNLPTQGYTDLVLKFSLRTDHTGVQKNMFIYINGGSTVVNGRILFGTGSSTGTFTDSTSNFSYTNTANYTANTFGNGELYIPNYRSSVAKSLSLDVVTENNGTEAVLALSTGLWNNTAAITSVTLDPEFGTILQHSTASLYGITAGSDGVVSVS